MVHLVIRHLLVRCNDVPLPVRLLQELFKLDRPGPSASVRTHCLNLAPLGAVLRADSQIRMGRNGSFIFNHDYNLFQHALRSHLRLALH